MECCTGWIGAWGWGGGQPLKPCETREWIGKVGGNENKLNWEK